jgi:hypothetical protein
MNKKIVFVMIVLTLGILGSSQSKYIQSSQSDQQSHEEKEIAKIIENAYKAEAKASRTFDLTDFSSVFINDPRFPMDADTLQVVREMTGNLSLESAGYLDYKLAYYSHWRDGALLLEELKEKAKKEKRELTEEESLSLVDEFGRSAIPRNTSGPRRTPIRINSIAIENDIAYAIVNDGPRTVELTLVLVDGHWYIAAIKGIALHP